MSTLKFYNSDTGNWEYAAIGKQGETGRGVPTAGTTGQFLAKVNNQSYNTQWVTLPSYQPLDSDLTAISNLTSNGILRKVSGIWEMDQSNYLIQSDLSPYLTLTTAATTYLTKYDAGNTYSVIGHNHSGTYEPVISYGTTSQYYRGDKTWQTLNKSTIGLSNVENTALSSWSGSSSVTTLGTVTSGVWSGTTIAYSKGGTGLTTLGTAYQVLRVNSAGNAIEWANIDAFPAQAGNNGKFLTTNGSTVSWEKVDALPSQSGNNGKFLTTNGSIATWQTIDLSIYLTSSSASSTYLTKNSAANLYQPIGSYLTSYTETDTLSSVTARGSSTDNTVSITNTTQSSSYYTGALVINGGVGIAKNLFVQGNLILTGDIDINGTITGSLQQVNVTDLNITDSLVYLGSENLTSDTLDIGIIGAYRPVGNTSGHKHTGFARDHNDSGIWKLFSGADEITGNDIDFGLNDININFDQLKIRSLIVTDASTTRTNLGLGTMAVETATDYLKAVSATSLYQPKDQDLTDIAALTGNGIIRKTAGIWGMDSNTYLTSYTETDPIFIASPSYGITSTNITNWNTAYTDRNKWDGGVTGLTAATGRTSLGLGTMATQAATSYAALASSNIFTTGGQVINNATNTLVPLTIRGSGTGGTYTQTADLQQWNTYNGTTSSTVAKVDYLGNMTAVSITLSSDERLKKNITPISGALDKIIKLNGYTFNRLDGNQREVGVIAQEVLKVMPELVKEYDGYYSVAYPNMVALLIESIKELKREIEELKNK